MVEFLDCETPDFMPPCCLVLIQLTFFISEPNKVHHQSRAATDTTSWERQACTHDTLWRQHYIITSKEYLTNGHILTKCYELVFLQLHLVKILCKLIIIWVNCERKKKSTFMKHHVYWMWYFSPDTKGANCILSQNMLLLLQYSFCFIFVCIFVCAS